MKKTIVLIVLILIFSVSTVGNVRAQGNTVSAVGNWHPGDAHVHSLHSLDGHRTISDIARDAADFGLDWIIMTDHSYDMDATEWQQAWDECEQAEADTGLVVMCGEELSVDEYEDDWPSDTGHYLCYGLSTFIATLERGCGLMNQMLRMLSMKLIIKAALVSLLIQMKQHGIGTTSP